MERILYNKEEIRKELTRLFSARNRRKVAISAFVGKDADYYLHNAQNVELYCWPKEGGTNPDTIRNLMKRGAKVWFVDSLHMKIYWVHKMGAIISSANLSMNALGSGNLKEIGVLLKHDDVDIKKIISSFRKRKPTKIDFINLDKKNDEYIKLNPKDFVKEERQTFKEWFDSAHRRIWKLGWYAVEGDLSKDAKDKSKNDYDRMPTSFVGCKRNQCKKNDWVLTFKLNKNQAKYFEWLFVDFIANDDGNGTWKQAIQVHKQNIYNNPPFRIDKTFKAAFNKALRNNWSEKIARQRSWEPQIEFINRIDKNLR